jgi:DNA (cytosine-5)-methyltransferase 1
MKYLSVCSGVEAASVAWHSLGWQPVAFSEIEPFPSAVLAHHYKEVPNLGDMTKFKDWKLNESIDILVGGTPCQSFSVAGLRKGLEDPRGNLALTYVGILDKFRPKWFIWENVPGVLSSGGGRDFGAFLGAVGELGYGWAYRVLDAQNFGVPQRRRRVFVVGCLGNWESAAKVLFESESLSGDSKPSRKKRKGVAGFVESSFGQYREDAIAGTIKASGGVAAGGSETFVTVYENHPSDSRVKDMGDTCQTVTSTWGSGGGNIPFVQSFGIPGNWIGRKPENGGNATTPMNDVAPCLTKTDRHGVAFGWQNSAHQGMSVDTISPTLDKSKTPAVAVAYDMKQHHNPHHTTNIQLTTGNCSTVRGDTPLIQNLMAVPYDLHQVTSPYNSQNRENGDPCHTLARDSAAHASVVTASTSVRRLTPVECERLQGFPDNYTQIPWNKKVSIDCPDGLRYKAMGNSMAVPVMNWIGTRINNLTD